MLVNLKLKFKLSLVYWLNSTQFKIESEICFLRKILKNIFRFGNFFCCKSPNHVQIYDLGHFLGKIITLLNLCLVLLLEQSIVPCQGFDRLTQKRSIVFVILLIWFNVSMYFNKAILPMYDLWMDDRYYPRQSTKLKLMVLALWWSVQINCLVKPCIAKPF